MKTWFSTNLFANLAHNARTPMYPNPTTNPSPPPTNLRKFPLPTPPTGSNSRGLVYGYFNYPRPQCTPILLRFRYNNKPSVAHCTSSKEWIYVLQTLKTIRSVRTQQAQRGRGFLFPLWTLHGRAVYLCHESARGHACVYTNLRKSWFCIEVGDN